MRILSWLSLCFVVVSSSACGSEDVAPPAHVARTSGGAVALSYDERIAVVVNRAASAVTVFTLKPERGLADMVTRSVELPMPEGSEPWAAVIGMGDDTAYVLLRREQAVARIDHLRKSPTLAAERVSVGSEPVALAITPSGKKLFVANYGEGTISMIDTARFQAGAWIDLNRSLSSTRFLGDDFGAERIRENQKIVRLGLAHPRGLTITDDGDLNDDDETLFATEFFSQPLEADPSEPTVSELERIDRSRQGFVYAVNVETGALEDPIALAPVRETGFVDSDGAMTSCFPNQLFDIASNNDRLYVTSLCTSPRGPLGPDPANFKTLLHPAVFVIKLETREQDPYEGKLLTKVLGDAYAADANEATVRMPLIPSSIAFRNNSDAGSSAFVAALGADALFRLDYNRVGNLQGVGAPGKRYTMLPTQGLPTGVAVSQRSKQAFALVQNDATQQLSVIDTVNQEATSKESASREDVKVSDANRGRAIFATGLDSWSYKGQAWSSCESCHPGGGTDGVTWYFSRGPRRTLSTASTYQKGVPPADARRRLLLWGANVDEIHDVEAIVRNVSGGAGGILWSYAPPDKPSKDCRLIYDGGMLPAADGLGGVRCPTPKVTSTLLNGLNGSMASITTGQGCAPGDEFCDNTGTRDWTEIDAFIRSLHAPRAPTGLDSTSVARGRELFEQGRCAGCHAGPLWTVSMLFYTPGAELNGALPRTPPSDLATAPVGLLRQAWYQVPVALAQLNPAASNQEGCLTGPCAAFRDTSLISTSYTPASQGDDQLRCALRDVGTFLQSPPNTAARGHGPAAANPAFEYRQNMKDPAQGALGFSVPSLFGLASTAPFFHGGNARTLEEVFAPEFARHYSALEPTFLSDPATRSADVDHLVDFLLSIDEATPLADLLTSDRNGAPLDYDFCQ